MQESGLVTEGLVMWLLGDDHIRDVCLNSPYIDRWDPSSSFFWETITSTRVSV